MAEVSFYHLERSNLDQALPKLLEKVVQAGMKAVVLAEHDEQIDALNAHLWAYDPASFLPHGAEKDGLPGAEQPIWLTTKEERPNGAEVLVLVDGAEPAFLPGFNRVLDIFDGRDEGVVAAARARWKKLGEAGHTLTYWQQTENGGWSKKA